MNLRIGSVFPVPAGPETRHSRGNVPVCARRFSLTSIRSSLGSLVHVGDFDARLGLVAIGMGQVDILRYPAVAILDEQFEVGKIGLDAFLGVADGVIKPGLGKSGFGCKPLDEIIKRLNVWSRSSALGIAGLARFPRRSKIFGCSAWV